MEKIESFKIDHTRLLPGLYVSRKDRFKGVTVTTFDLRFTVPNRMPPVDVPALHTIEHLFATYLRNGEDKERIVYFGPMGCRTGCYLILFGDLESEDVFDLVLSACDFALNFNGDIPGATEKECGNYREQNLVTAKYFVSNYKKELEEYRRFTYPE